MTKIHTVVSAEGRPLYILIAEGQRNDNLFAKRLLKWKKAKHVMGDMAYDSNAIRDYLKITKQNAVIPSSHNRINSIYYNKRLYKKRNVIERFFQKIKRFRRIGTRYDKKIIMFKGMIILACILCFLIY